MFDIGFQELVLIFVIALLVFGPEKLPEVGRTLGKWLVEIRRGVQNAKVQMESEFEEAEKMRSREEQTTPEKGGEIEGAQKDDKESDKRGDTTD